MAVMSNFALYRVSSLLVVLNKNDQEVLTVKCIIISVVNDVITGSLASLLEMPASKLKLQTNSTQPRDSVFGNLPRAVYDIGMNGISCGVVVVDEN